MCRFSAMLGAVARLVLRRSRHQGIVLINQIRFPRPSLLSELLLKRATGIRIRESPPVLVWGPGPNKPAAIRHQSGDVDIGMPLKNQSATRIQRTCSLSPTRPRQCICHCGKLGAFKGYLGICERGLFLELGCPGLWSVVSQMEIFRLVCAH